MGAQRRPTVPGCCVAQVGPFCSATPGQSWRFRVSRVSPSWTTAHPAPPRSGHRGPLHRRDPPGTCPSPASGSGGFCHPAVLPLHPEAGSPRSRRQRPGAPARETEARPTERGGRRHGRAAPVLARGRRHTCFPRCLRTVTAAAAGWLWRWGWERARPRGLGGSRPRGREARERPQAELGGADRGPRHRHRPGTRPPSSGPAHLRVLTCHTHVPAAPCAPCSPSVRPDPQGTHIYHNMCRWTPTPACPPHRPLSLPCPGARHMPHTP